MFEALIEIILFVAIASALGISVEAAQIVVAIGGLLIVLWIGFQSALNDARKRQRKRIPIGRVTRRATGLVDLPPGKSEREMLEDAMVEKYGL